MSRVRRTPPEANELAARRSSPPGERRVATGDASHSAGVERRLARSVRAIERALLIASIVLAVWGVALLVTIWPAGGWLTLCAAAICYWLSRPSEIA